MNFLLNELVDILEKEAQSAKDDQETLPSEKAANGPTNTQVYASPNEPLVTWVHKSFQVSFFRTSMVWKIVQITTLSHAMNSFACFFTSQPKKSCFKSK